MYIVSVESIQHEGWVSANKKNSVPEPWLSFFNDKDIFPIKENITRKYLQQG